MSENWSRDEVEAIVADYFSMLARELRGEDYNKTERRRNLIKFLDDRSAGSVERKHQNISAVMLKLGFPYVSGYKPLSNYQQLLFEVVADRLGMQRDLDDIVSRQVIEAAIEPEVEDILASMVSPPVGRRLDISDSDPALDYPSAIQRSPEDHFAREARNASLGLAGEKFVVHYEQARLRHGGNEKLADRVEHVAQTRGDGLGFDILSYEENGHERLIEVKTTRYAIETPFYVTSNEVKVSRARAKEFQLYRVFEFRGAPRIFSLRGALDEVCTLHPVEYRGTVS